MRFSEILGLNNCAENREKETYLMSTNTIIYLQEKGETKRDNETTTHEMKLLMCPDSEWPLLLSDFHPMLTQSKNF